MVIPARGGSKGIPLKNLQAVGEDSLLARAVKASLAAPHVSAVLVSTDSELIAREAARYGAVVVRRPGEIAGDSASSESAVLHTLDAYEAGGHLLPDVTVLVQCTSPFINPGALNAAITRVLAGSEDVVFSATEDHSFSWTVDTAGAHAVGHDPSHRLRRQDLPPSYRETGAFYAMNTAGLRAARNRFFGRIGIEAVPRIDSIEIDSPEDLAICRAIEHAQAVPLEESGTGGAEGTGQADFDVDALITDFDGVHTNDTAILSADGSEQVQVSRSDGMGVARLRNRSIPFLILSTERNPIVSARAKKLGVDVLQGVDDKASALTAWLSANRLDPQRVAYVGNDVNDLPAMALVGWPVAVADARPEVKSAARHVLSRKGGQGAVREICDIITACTSPLPTPSTQQPFPHA